MTIDLTSLDEKWLLVDQLRSGQLWKDRQVLRGQSLLNLHSKTYRQIALELASAELASAGQTLVGLSTVAILIRQACQQLHDLSLLQYFTCKASDWSGLSRLLASTWQELRLAGLDHQHLRHDCCEVAEKADDLRAIYSLTQSQLHSSGWVDYADCLRISIASLQSHQVRLPPALRILQPEEFPVMRLEQVLLQQLIARGADYQPPPPSSNIASSVPTGLQAAIGSVNEVRAALQAILYRQSSPLPLDQVEIVHTDYVTYVPLILETLTRAGVERKPGPAKRDNQPGSEARGQDAAASSAESEADVTEADVTESAVVGPTLDQLPATFAEGIACVYSRPGRLLRSWIRWLSHDCNQTQAVQMVREGLISRPESVDACGYARLAHTLRRIPIGFGLGRYTPQIAATLSQARLQCSDYNAQPNADARPRDFGIPALEALCATLQPLLDLTVPIDAGPVALLQAAKTLLLTIARADSKLDRYARARLVEEVESMLQLVTGQGQAVSDIGGWLEELPVNSFILASSPQPGCMHVAPLGQGGGSGRPYVFVMGLDDDRYPKRPAVDPILLDEERQRLSQDLLTAPARRAYQQAALARIMSRLNQVAGAQLQLSYSIRDLVEDRGLHPSSELAQLNATPGSVPVAFVGQGAQQALHAGELEQQYLLGLRDTSSRKTYLCQRYTHIEHQYRANEAIHNERFGPYDGLVPIAGIDAVDQLANTVMSPSRLEVLGACPRKYFFQRVLGVHPPDQWDVDTQRWLNPLQIGSLLHELLEAFVRTILPERRAPDRQLDSELLTHLLDQHLAEWAEEIPPPSQSAWQETRDELLETCEIFLLAEQEYSAHCGGQPLYLEVALGTTANQTAQLNPTHGAASSLDTATPLTITLGSGRQLQLAGRVDRIDQIITAEGPRLMIWDYKSGSDSNYALDDPFDQGRHLQPLLYLRMVQARLRQLGRKEEKVHGFGYFFPSARSEGRRMQWNEAELTKGQAILERLIDLLAAGTFTATDRREDCSRCDFSSICGPAKPLTELTQLKSQLELNSELAAWRKLRYE